MCVNFALETNTGAGNRTFIIVFHCCLFVAIRQLQKFTLFLIIFLPIHKWRTRGWDLSRVHLNEAYEASQETWRRKQTFTVAYQCAHKEGVLDQKENNVNKNISKHIQRILVLLYQKTRIFFHFPFHDLQGEPKLLNLIMCKMQLKKLLLLIFYFFSEV